MVSKRCILKGIDKRKRTATSSQQGQASDRSVIIEKAKIELHLHFRNDPKPFACLEFGQTFLPQKLMLKKNGIKQADDCTNMSAKTDVHFFKKAMQKWNKQSLKNKHK